MAQINLNRIKLDKIWSGASIKNVIAKGRIAEKQSYDWSIRREMVNTVASYWKEKEA